MLMIQDIFEFFIIGKFKFMIILYNINDKQIRKLVLRKNRKRKKD
jgi:hypothetical protein